MPADPIGASLRRELKEYVLDRLPGPVRAGLRRSRRRVRRIHDIAALDDALRSAYEAFQRSEDEGRRVLDGIELVVDARRPADPASEAYRQNELALYERLARRPYAVSNERSLFDPHDALVRPFPYRTGSTDVVGDQLILIGYLLKAIAVPPPARILEFGPGWGNTTLALLQTGYRVTAVEIDPAFVALIRERARDHADRLELVTQDMLDYRSAERADVVVFFESFHHCVDHRRMLANLHDLVADGGTVLFVAEPILDLPYPWGLRLDGHSLWSIRQLGWLELGFDRSYFMRALRDTGWTGTRLHSRGISSLPDIVVARRSA